MTLLAVASHRITVSFHPICSGAFENDMLLLVVVAVAVFFCCANYFPVFTMDFVQFT
jgi:hypothetical protein